MRGRVLWDRQPLPDRQGAQSLTTRSPLSWKRAVHFCSTGRKIKTGRRPGDRDHPGRTQGQRGHVGNLQQILASLGTPQDRIIVNGCNYLMMRASQESQPLKIRTMVSLNTLMIDGTGMCGVCRLTVNSSTKFACVDGPHFDGHEVDWDELTQRRQLIYAKKPSPCVPARRNNNKYYS